MKESPCRKSVAKKKGELPDSSLLIVKAENSRTRNAFIRLPWSLYRDDPKWVPPLILERRLHLSPKNPYFEHATCCLWVAYRDNKPVGRISAQVDQLHLERYQDSTGFWGLLEAEDNLQTFQALFAAAESWLQGQGMKRSQGPFNLSINHECGLLVEGFDTEPSVMMGHALPYYAEHIEQCGYTKVKDLLAYILDTDVEPTEVRKAITRRTQNRIKTRILRKKHFQEDLDIVFSIFNDAWSGNWGFVPFTKKELVHLANDMKLLIKEDLVRIAYVGDEPSAFMVLLPNLNEAIKDLNGRLFPFGWLKLLWRLKVKAPQTGRVPLMGVLRKHQGSLLGAALAYRVLGDMQEAVIRRGIKKAEMSWILEDNVGVRGIIEDVGGRIYKTYRIFNKEL